MDVCAKEIWTRGKLFRIASLNGEDFQFLHDPETTLKCVRNTEW